MLLIGLFDPTGKQDVPADAVTCAAQGVHSVCAVTGIAIADSADTMHIELRSAEQLDEQVRCLLEDTPVQAIKVGFVPTIEQISVIAQIAADYADVPLILHLGPKPRSEGEDDSPEEELDLLAHATLELLVPQSEMVVIGPNSSDRWLDPDLTEMLDVGTGPQALLKLGADWVFVAGYRQRPGSRVNFLVAAEGITTSWPWHSAAERTQDSTGLLACSVAAWRAAGQSPEKACELACKYEAQAMAQAFQAGMGHRTARRMPENDS